MRFGIISDTHIPSRAQFVPARVIHLFEGVDRILHAGDICEQSVLDELAAVAPVDAVLGNMDPPAALIGVDGDFVIEADGVRIGMIHDAGPSIRRRAAMRRRFQDCRVVVFGHSHQPMIEDEEGLLLLNPGSACDPRMAKHPTVALLEIQGGEPTAQIVRL